MLFVPSIDDSELTDFDKERNGCFVDLPPVKMKGKTLFRRESIEPKIY